jgi:sporulation protein YabP
MNSEYGATGAASAHRLELEGRERLRVSGVEDVERFDEGIIVMSTAEGILTVTGESLHIGQLSLDGGELHVDGRIDAVAYEEPTQPRGGLMRRLFG